VIEADTRSKSFGQGHRLTAIDRFGIWLSNRKIGSLVDSFDGLFVADVGCGFNASFTRSIIDRVDRAMVVDIALANDLKDCTKILALEGLLPDALQVVQDQSLDIVVCNNLIEHLWEPMATLRELRRITKKDGFVFVNVPSWRGKWFLELSAFRLGTSPATEMNDHKMYYDLRDLWPLLVRAGFIPEHIRVGTHKFGLNTYAVCRP
jgi:SAM-dependent methyltransferase